MYASRMNARFISLPASSQAQSSVRAESPNYFVYVSNERSGDVSVIDGATDASSRLFKQAKGRAEFTQRQMANDSL